MVQLEVWDGITKMKKRVLSSKSPLIGVRMSSRCMKDSRAFQVNLASCMGAGGSCSDEWL